MKYSNILLIILIVITLGCEQETDLFQREDESLNDTERLISQDWSYSEIFIDEVPLNIIIYDFEPVQGSDDTQQIRFRWLKYSNDKTYEFRDDTTWDGFVLGEEENYQPNFGYWTVSVNNDTLFHNERESYVTAYKIIEINETQFIREYERVIRRTSDSTVWYPGDTVVYREILVPRIR